MSARTRGRYTAAAIAVKHPGVAAREAAEEIEAFVNKP